MAVSATTEKELYDILQPEIRKSVANAISTVNNEDGKVARGIKCTRTHGLQGSACTETCLKQSPKQSPVMVVQRQCQREFLQRQGYDDDLGRSGEHLQTFRDALHECMKTTLGLSLYEHIKTKQRFFQV
jgi:hypothetical protein